MERAVATAVATTVRVAVVNPRLHVPTAEINLRFQLLPGLGLDSAAAKVPKATATIITTMATQAGNLEEPSRLLSES
jgi:hypothetical protein